MKVADVKSRLDQYNLYLQCGNNIHLMYGPKGNSFVFPRVLMLCQGKHHDSREKKTN